MSVLSALWTAVEPGWVLTPAGYAALGIWNLLVVGMGVLALVTLRRRPSARPRH